MEYYKDPQGRRNIAFKVHPDKEADILLKLSGVNKQNYIKQLIRDDLDLEQIKKMKCMKCGAPSKTYLKLKRYDADNNLIIPLCQDCANKWLGGFIDG